MQFCHLLLTRWPYRRAELVSAGCSSLMGGCERYHTIGGNCLGTSGWVPVMVRRVWPSPETALVCMDPHITTMQWVVSSSVGHFSTTTRRPWLWWASSWGRFSRRVKNIFSIEWLNTHGASVALNIELLLTTSFRCPENETAISLEKRNEVQCYELFQVVKLSFKREINHSKQHIKSTDRKTRQQGVEDTQSLASLAHPHHSQFLINLSICWTGR